MPKYTCCFAILLLFSSLALSGCKSHIDQFDRQTALINEATSVCNSRAIRNEFKTRYELLACRYDAIVPRAYVEKMPDADLLDSFFTKQKELASEFDQKKISDKQYLKLADINLGDHLAKIDARQKARMESDLAAQSIGLGIAQGLQNMGRNMQQQSIQNRPVTCFSMPMGGGYGAVNCY